MDRPYPPTTSNPKYLEWLWKRMKNISYIV
ncbi:hypothetical protein EhV156_00237 [Emiliania huxleyi virus 156]|nr:hypothetical protein EhV156_00237 [Emiliania huxleyi virus 156]